MLKVGKDIVTPTEIARRLALLNTHTGASAFNVEAIESKLQEFLDESLRLESENERIMLLNKKREWAAYDMQHNYVTSLNGTFELLNQQSLELQKQLESFESKLAEKRPLKQLW